MTSFPSIFLTGSLIIPLLPTQLLKLFQLPLLLIRQMVQMSSEPFRPGGGGRRCDGIILRLLVVVGGGVGGTGFGGAEEGHFLLSFVLGPRLDSNGGEGCEVLN